MAHNTYAATTCVAISGDVSIARPNRHRGECGAAIGKTGTGTLWNTRQICYSFRCLDSTVLNFTQHQPSVSNTIWRTQRTSRAFGWWHKRISEWAYCPGNLSQEETYVSAAKREREKKMGDWQKSNSHQLRQKPTTHLSFNLTRTSR